MDTIFEHPRCNKYYRFSVAMLVIGFYAKTQEVLINNHDINDNNNSDYYSYKLHAKCARSITSLSTTNTTAENYAKKCTLLRRV